MFLQEKLRRAAAEARPVRVCLIGAGKFGSMFLSQVPSTDGVEVTQIADLDPDRARGACLEVGWSDALIGATKITDDAPGALTSDDVDVVVEATGSPHAGVRHARAAIAAGKHVVMVNVEADVLAGAALAKEARAAGVVYSMAYGDQPALTAEIVDWARGRPDKERQDATLRAAFGEEFAQLHGPEARREEEGVL
ncbi:MAG: Gfo/Idh/MocA family oxidoreductase, partial [Pseudomonadota bacterium]